MSRAYLGACLLVVVGLTGCTSESELSQGPKAVQAAASATADRLDTLQEARQAGYEPERFCVPGMGVHWVNPQHVDTTLVPDQPEVVLFEPQTKNVSDPDEQRFVGVEYVAVTEGTDHNTSQTVPEMLGVELEGPMASHTPNMPWHADLHVFLADGIPANESVGTQHPSITCPEGTTPPGGK